MRPEARCPPRFAVCARSPFDGLSLRGRPHAAWEGSIETSGCQATDARSCRGAGRLDRRWRDECPARNAALRIRSAINLQSFRCTRYAAGCIGGATRENGRRRCEPHYVKFGPGPDADWRDPYNRLAPRLAYTQQPTGRRIACVTDARLSRYRARRRATPVLFLPASRLVASGRLADRGSPHTHTNARPNTKRMGSES